MEAQLLEERCVLVQSEEFRADDTNQCTSNKLNMAIYFKMLLGFDNTCDKRL